VTPRDRPPLLVLIGPTASGKSELAHAVALSRGGEIVSADAYTVYRGLDVGTAKPAPDRRREVRYHMLDVAEPDEAYSAGRFALEARRAVENCTERGSLPIVCGGSGFYVAALLGGLPPGEVRDEAVRAGLSRWARRRGREAAHRFLAVNDPVSARKIPPANLKYTLRALEILLSTGEPASHRAPEGDAWAAQFRVVKIGLRLTAAQRHARIEDRVRRMLDEGWDQEVRRLLDNGLSWDSNSFQAIGYREVAEWVLGRISKREAQERIVAATRGLAKRQKTWFARERDVHWVAPDEAPETVFALFGEAKGRETQ
jgi:tRNA dimethylallyltransferase